jgi:hypothetical protein
VDVARAASALIDGVGAWRGPRLHGGAGAIVRPGHRRPVPAARRTLPPYARARRDRASGAAAPSDWRALLKHLTHAGRATRRARRATPGRDPEPGCRANRGAGRGTGGRASPPAHPHRPAAEAPSPRNDIGGSGPAPSSVTSGGDLVRARRARRRSPRRGAGTCRWRRIGGAHRLLLASARLQSTRCSSNRPALARASKSRRFLVTRGSCREMATEAIKRSPTFCRSVRTARPQMFAATAAASSSNGRTTHAAARARKDCNWLSNGLPCRIASSYPRSRSNTVTAVVVKRPCVFK